MEIDKPKNVDRTSSDGADADAVIVSAYGRGNWLAGELASRGWRVTLTDVTEKLGAVDPEDAEGPFGLLEASDLLQSQKTRLVEEGETVTVPTGFSLWLKDGPVEFRSELTSFHMNARDISKTVETYLRHPGLPDKESERMRKTLSRMTFREAWLAHFAHQFASPVVEENHRALDEAMPSPLFAPFSVRRVSQAGWQRGLKAVQAAGAKVRPRASIRDIRLNNKLVDAIEIGDDRAGIERGKAFVWMVSSSESQQFPKPVHETLFPDGDLRPDWYWTRYRVDMTNMKTPDQLPIYSVLLEDPFLPWTHTNVIILRAKPEVRSYDAWVKLPLRARESADDLRAIGTEIEAILTRRVPGLNPKVLELPMEAQVGAEVVGAVRMPVYNDSRRNQLKTLKANNIFFCGPEQWPSLDWIGQSRKQITILAKLEKLRAQWLAAAARERARNSKP